MRVSALLLAAALALAGPVAAHAEVAASGQTVRTISFNGAGAMFPGTVYQNRHQIPGAQGLIHITLPGSNAAPLMLQMTFRNLLPNKTYKVFIDKDGTTPAGNHSFGPWSEAGQFSATPSGSGQFQYQATPGSIASGNHTWAVFVSRTDVGATVLISDNFSFTLP